MDKKPIYQQIDISEPLNKLTVEACESLQDMLINKCSNTNKEEIYQLIKEWVIKYNIIIGTIWRL